MKTFKIGDLVRHIKSHSVKGLHLVVQELSASPNKAVRIQSVADGSRKWISSKYLEAACR